MASSSSSLLDPLYIVSPPSSHYSRCFLHNSSSSSSCSKWKRSQPFQLGLLRRRCHQQHVMITIHQTRTPLPPPAFSRFSLPDQKPSSAPHRPTQAEESTENDSCLPAQILPNEEITATTKNPGRKKTRRKKNVVETCVPNPDENRGTSCIEETISLVRRVDNAEDTTLHEDTNLHEDTTSQQDTTLHEDITFQEVTTSHQDTSCLEDTVRHGSTAAFDDDTTSSEVIFNHEHVEIIGQTNGKNGSKLKKRSKVSQSKSGGKNGDNLMLSTTDEKSLDQSLGPDPEGSKHILLPKDWDSEPNLVAEFEDVVGVEYDVKSGGNIIDVTNYVETLPVINSPQSIGQLANVGKQKPRKRKTKGEIIKQGEIEMVDTTSTKHIHHANIFNADKRLDDESRDVKYDPDNKVENNLRVELSKQDILFEGAEFEDVVSVEYDMKAGGHVIDVTNYVETLPFINSLQSMDQLAILGKKKPRRRKNRGEIIEQSENEMVDTASTEDIHHANMFNDDKRLDGQSRDVKYDQDNEVENNLRGELSKQDILFQGNTFREGESVHTDLDKGDGGVQSMETMLVEDATSENLEAKKSRLSKKNKRSRRQKSEDSNLSKAQYQSTCTVRWLVKAHLNENQKLFLVGGNDHLGSWNPDVAIAFSECKGRGQPHMWEGKVKVPFGTHCEYNYFVQVGDEENRSIVWRPGPKLQLSVPSLEDAGHREMTIKSNLDFNVENKLPSLLWGGLQSEIGFPDDLRRFLGDKPSLEEENSSIVLTSGGDVDRSTERQEKKPDIGGVDVKEEHVNIPQVRLESGGMESKVGSKISKKHQTNEQMSSVRLTPKLKKYIRKRVFPREEPWLMESMILNEKGGSFRSVVATPDEMLEDVEENEDAVEKIPDLPTKIEQNKEVLTDILISSSKCTMERIAIVEDGKLVELLLKQVNADISVGNVYLGIVKKLLPGMTGVFVDIGHPRVALLSISKNVYPYTFPPIVANDTEELAIDNQEEVSSEHGHMYDPEEQFEIEDEDDEDNEMLEDLNEEESPLENSIDASFHSDVPEKQERKRLLQINGNISKRITVNFGQRYTKWRKVEEGMRIIVQVRREPLGKKGPKVCAFPQLSSRFWVLGLGGRSTGVSKKINGPERKRLKDIAKLFRKPGFDLTARTEAAGQSQEDLEKDMMRLMETWKGIVEQAEAASMAADNGQDGAVPVVLHRGMGQTLSIVRDFFAEKVHRMVVDSAQTYHEVTSYLQEVAPKLLNRVELYTGTMPIFDVFNLEPEIDKLLNERVQLPNGAYLVIQETEALVSIDVNGGTGMLGKNMKSDAILEANLAAARQIAIEIRLRDIGGIIVIDFIDMDDDEHETRVSQEMRNAIQSDRSIIHILEISELGLMELTRRRVRPSVTFMISDPCPCCRGSGRVEALETTFSKIERAILRLVANHPENIHFDGRMWKRVLLRVDPIMFEFLTRKQRAAQLSSSLKVYIILKVGRDMARGSFELSEMKAGTEKKISTNENNVSSNEKKVTGNSEKKISSSGQQRRNLSRKGVHMGSTGSKAVASTT